MIWIGRCAGDSRCRVSGIFPPAILGGRRAHKILARARRPPAPRRWNNPGRRWSRQGSGNGSAPPRRACATAPRAAAPKARRRVVPGRCRRAFRSPRYRGRASVRAPATSRLAEVGPGVRSSALERAKASRRNWARSRNCAWALLQPSRSIPRSAAPRERIAASSGRICERQGFFRQGQGLIASGFAAAQGAAGESKRVLSRAKISVANKASNSASSRAAAARMRLAPARPVTSATARIFRAQGTDAVRGWRRGRWPLGNRRVFRARGATRSGKARRSERAGERSRGSACSPSAFAASRRPCFQPCARRRASFARGPASLAQRSRRSPRSTASPPSPRSVSSTASSHARSPRRALARQTMRARRGGSGNFRMALPRAVMAPCVSSAPSSCQQGAGLALAAAGGGSSQRRALGSRAPQAARSSSRPASRRRGFRAGRRRAATPSPPPPTGGSRRRVAFGRRGPGAGRRRPARREKFRAGSGRGRARSAARGRGRNRSPRARRRW